MCPMSTRWARGLSRWTISVSWSPSLWVATWRPTGPAGTNRSRLPHFFFQLETQSESFIQQCCFLNPFMYLSNNVVPLSENSRGEVLYFPTANLGPSNAGELLDSNRELEDNSMVRYQWTTTSPLIATRSKKKWKLLNTVHSILFDSNQPCVISHYFWKRVRYFNHLDIFQEIYCNATIKLNSYGK